MSRCSTEFIRVMARIRPSAMGSDNAVTTANGKTRITITTERVNKVYEFDEVFSAEVSQDVVFKMTGQRIIQGCVDGYNGTIFAYGQTGSGKTYTMMGPVTVDNSYMDPDLKGLIPRSVDFLFGILESTQAERGRERFTFAVDCYFLELYNEELYDLLAPNQIVTLRSEGNIKFENATCETVMTCTDIMRVVQKGFLNRKVAATAMNRESSRSHALFIMDVKTMEFDGSLTTTKIARLNLVDLAGSERQAHARTEGERLKEATSINKSLSTLGRVIRSLSDAREVERRRRGQACHIPYRDSKLTYILSESLGGNSRTAVVVNVHPDKQFLGDSMSTLQFAQQCRMIKNSAVANNDVTGENVMAFKAEIARLVQALADKDTETAHSLEEANNEAAKWKTQAIRAQRDIGELNALGILRSVQQETQTQGFTESEVLHEWRERIASRFETVRTSEDLQLVALEEQLVMAKAEVLRYQARCHEHQQQLNILTQRNLALVNESVVQFQNGVQVRTEPAAVPMTPRDRRLRRLTGLFRQPDQAARPADMHLPAPINQNEEITRLERDILKWEVEVNRLNQLLSEKDEDLDRLTTSILDINRERRASEEELNQRISYLETEERRLKEDSTEMAARIHAEIVKTSQRDQRILDLDEESRDLRRQLDDTTDQLEAVTAELIEVRSMQEQVVAEKTADLKAQLQNLRIEQSASTEEAVRRLEQTHQVELERLLSVSADKDSQIHALENVLEVGRRRDVQSQQKLAEKNEELTHCRREEERLCTLIENLEAARRVEVQRYREENEDQKENLERLLATEKAAHATTRTRSLQRHADLETIWQQRLDEAEENFEARAIRETSALRSELELLRSEYAEIMEEKENVSRERDDLKEHISESDRMVSMVAGHQNHRQKVHVIERMRTDKMELTRQNTELRNKLDKANAALAVLKRSTPSNGPGVEQMVTRSRGNTQESL